MRTVLGILVAGAVGAVLRYEVDGLITSQTAGGFPWGTFAVNVSGSFVLALLYTVLVERFSVDPTVRFSLTVGLLGSYTTFSTLTFDSVRLFQEGYYLQAAANSIGTVLIGMIAAALGIVVGRTV
ncbi:MAG TPA: fluoride efflux transporter CrcB [Chloroflexota bacterium]|nr:fluoride efflux transporter CrcB [Chloroflexota bacterium]